MSNRPRASIATWLRRSVILVAIVLAILWMLQAFVLPGIVKSLITRQLASVGYGDATLTVDHASLSSSTIRDLHSPAGLDVRVLHVTYSPLSLLAGRVGDIAVSGLFARVDSYRQAAMQPSTEPAATSPATRPPFDRLSVEDARIEIATPAGPTTAQLELDAVEQQDHRVLATVDASTAGLRLQATVNADPALATWDLTGRVDADLAMLPAYLARQDLSLAGQLRLVATGQVRTSPGFEWSLSDLTIDANVDSAAMPPVAIRDARLNLRAKAAGDSLGFAADLLPESSITAGEVRSGEGIPAFAAALRPRDLAVSRANDAWTIRTEGADVQVGDLEFAFHGGQIVIAQPRVTGQIESSLELARVGGSRLLQAIFPALQTMQLGGTAQLLFTRAARAGAGGEDLPSLTLRIVDGTIASQEYALTADGINSQIVLLGIANPHTPPGQQLTMHYGQMGKWEVRDALFQFTLTDLNTLSVERTELGWLGGKIWADPFELKFDSPIIRSRVYGNELDLGKLVWIVSNEKAWAEGLVDLDIPLTFRWPRMRFGDGFVAARPGGKLHLDYVADSVGDYLTATDPRFVTDPTYSLVRERVVKALREFRYSKLRMELERGPEHLDTLVQVAGKGDYEGGQEVNLNVTVADLDWLISRYLAMPKTQLTTE